MLMICALAVSSALTNIRLGSLQLEDLLLLALLGFCIAKTMCSGFSFRIATDLRVLLKSYGLLLLAIFCSAVFAIRLKFYPLDAPSLLMHPVLMSVSKLLQFVAILCGFFWLTNKLIKQRKSLIVALSAYWWIGIICSLYAICSYCVLEIFRFNAPDIFGAYENLDGVVRARGFFNEGGPFGMYVVSVYVAGILKRRITGARVGMVNTILLLLALLLSSSKAGLIAAIFLALYFALSAASFRAKVCYLVLAVVVLGGAAVWLDLPGQLIGYLYSYQYMEEELMTHSNDYNLVLGRVSGLYIVPRMILAHPITGIGFGNYPLMRNDPNYLGSLPAITEVEDLPALGIPGIAAEIGIPATAWLLILLFLPYWTSRKRAPGVALGTIFQPISCILAVQLTFFYPWFIAACALAASCTESEEIGVEQECAE